MLPFIIVALISYYLYNWLVIKRRGLPPGPTPWPIVGNLLQIDMRYPDRSLAKWSAVYGKVTTVWLPDPIVCVNDFELIKKHFIKNGDAFAGRPTNYIIGQATANFTGLIFSSGRRWKEQRRFAINVLRDFGFGRNHMEQKIMLEGHWLVEQFCATEQQPFDPWHTIEVAVANIIANILIGHRYEPTEPRYLRLKCSLDEGLRAFASPLSRMVDMWPWLRHLPYFRAACLDVLRCRREINQVIMEFIEEHRRSFDPSKESEDFVNAYLAEIDRRKTSATDMGYFDDNQLVNATADLMIAGMETTVSTLRWGIAYLISYPDIQEKAHKELDTVIGSQADITMADRARLPYNSAVVQEMQRVSNILPINLPHTTTEDVEIEGYLVKAGSKCLPQVGNVMTDPTVFPKPELFDPTRFLNDDMSPRKVDELAPFGVGKRQCLGESLARAELFLLYATLMQGFRFVAPLTCAPVLQPVKAFVRKPIPFECIAIKRH